MTRRPKHPDVGRQPDGDPVEEKADGFVFSESLSLSTDENFTSGFTDTDGWATVEVVVAADKQSADDGVKLEYTDDVQTSSPEVLASRSKEYTIQDANRGFAVFEFPAILDGFRISYTNNGEVASDVDIFVTLRTMETAETNQYIDTNALGQEFVRVGSSQESTGVKIGDPSSLFGDLKTIERTTVVDLISSFGTSVLNDEVTSTNSGSITQDPDPDTGEIVLSTGTTADSSIELRSAEYGRYTAGFSGQAGLGIRLPSLPDEGEIRWGYFDDNNGFYFGYDPTEGELFVARRENGTEVERITQSDFNGFNPDEVYDRDFALAEGNIFQIDFSWYGFGIINFQVVSQTEDVTSARTPRQETVNLHSIAVRDGTSTSDPNQPINVEVENGSNGEDVEARVGGRQFSINGTLPTGGRITADTNISETVANGSWTHIMSWRRKNGTSGIQSNARLNVEDLDFAIDQTAKLAIIVNANISTNNFTTPTLTPTDETELEVSKNETFNGLDGGRKAWEASVKSPGTGVAQADIGDVDVDVAFGQNNTVTLIAQASGDTGDSVSTMRLSEDY